MQYPKLIIKRKGPVLLSTYSEAAKTADNIYGLDKAKQINRGTGFERVVKKFYGTPEGLAKAVEDGEEGYVAYVTGKNPGIGALTGGLEPMHHIHTYIHTHILIRALSSITTLQVFISDDLKITWT